MTIKDVATLANVSVATVSRVINGSPNVRPVIRERVLAVIQKNHYIPNSQGRNLRKLENDLILFMTPDMGNSFYSSICLGIEQVAARNGLNVLSCSTNNDPATEQKYINLLFKHQVDGVISGFSSFPPSTINRISRDFAYVQVCEITANALVSCVSIDNESAFYTATRYLLSLGHSRVWLLTSGYYAYSSVARETGYRRAMAESGQTGDPAICKMENHSLECGYEGAQRIFSAPSPPTALLCTSDSLAVGACQFFREHDIQVGTEVDVVGCDNTPLAQICFPQLTTVSQPQFELGTIAADLLMEKIRDGKSIVKKITVPHDLVIRASTRALPADSGGAAASGAGSR